MTQRTCPRCQIDFEAEGRRVYCTPACAAAQKSALDKSYRVGGRYAPTVSRSESMARRAESEEKREAVRSLARAKERYEAAAINLARVRDDVGPEIRQFVEAESLQASRARAAEDKADEAALENAKNVTEIRCTKFIETVPEVERLMVLFGWRQGLTSFDLDAMIAHMKGNPRPIVIAPEEPMTAADMMDDIDYFGDDEEEEKEAA